MSEPNKETLYIDVDDEITAVIDKVRGAKGKIVALVLPKRASVMQSTVNMKLLKRTAEESKKHLVLVTTEAGLMPLAGLVGLHVAASPTSKPVIPPAPDMPSDEPEDVSEPLAITSYDDDALQAQNEEEPDEFDPKTAAATPVGELAGGAAAGKALTSQVDEELTLNDAAEPAAATDKAKPKKAKTAKNKKLAVPNFDSFRKKLFIGGTAAIVLIAGLIAALIILPHAMVTIKTDTSTIPTNLTLNIDTANKTVDTDNNSLPAVAQTVSKTYSQQVPATGQQNNGNQAAGSVKFSIQKCTQPIGSAPADIPAGSSATSNGKTYILQSNASYGFTGFAQGGNCANYSTNTVNIQALKGGADYNTGNSASFTSGSATGTGSASGGTDNITKIVQQSDIDGAKAKIQAQDTTAVKQDLQSGLQGKSAKAITATFLAGDPQVTNSANAGDTADTVTVTEVISYSMLGVKQSDLEQLINAKIDSKIDKSKQVVLDNGASKASFGTPTSLTASAASLSLQTKSVAGPDLRVDDIKKQIAGKKAGDVKSLISSTPGVTNVDVSFGPFWVNTVPGKANKIDIVIDKSGN